MPEENTKKGHIGASNFQIDVDPDFSIIFLELENGNFIQLAHQAACIHILTAFKVHGEATVEELGDNPTVNFECVIKPVFQASSHPNDFKKSLPDDFRDQITKIANSIAPNICNRAKTPEAWRASHNTSYNGEEYKLKIQYS